MSTRVTPSPRTRALLLGSILLLALVAVNAAWRADTAARERALAEMLDDEAADIASAIARLDDELRAAIVFIDRAITGVAISPAMLKAVFPPMAEALPPVRRREVRALVVEHDAFAFEWGNPDAEGLAIEVEQGGWTMRAIVDLPRLLDAALSHAPTHGIDLGLRRPGADAWLYLRLPPGDADALTRLARSTRVRTIDTRLGRFEVVGAPSPAFDAAHWPVLTLVVAAGALVTLMLIALLLRAEQRTARLAIHRKRIARAMLDAIPFPISFLDSHGRYVEFNRALAELVGRSFRELKHAHPREVWGDGVWRSEIRPRFERALAGAIVEHEFTIERNGERRCMLGSFVPWRDARRGNAPRGVIVLTQDITERKRLERERIEAIERQERAHKWEDLGIIAGGVAHDLNNMLGVISGAIEHALDGGADAREMLSAALEMTDQAGRLCHQLLIYAGKGSKRRDPIHPFEVVHGVARMLRAGAPVEVRIEARAARRMPPILGDRSQIDQALFNLGLNAVQAIGRRKGTVEIEAVAVAGHALDWATHGLSTPAQAVVFIVRDDGPGIPPEVRRRMFTPFFTTRKDGTGMGLAVVFGAVRAHRGFIEVESEPGRGTTFRLALPAEERWIEAAGEAWEARARRPMRAGGRGRVAMVVDDEPMLRRLMRIAFERLGFQVVEASDGREALSRLEQGPTPAFVLMDMRMPNMNGIEALREMRARGWTMPVILVSGAVPDDADDGPRPDAWLDKPVRIEEIRDALARLGVLDA